MSLVTVVRKEGWILLCVTAGGHHASEASPAAPPHPPSFALSW